MLITGTGIITIAPVQVPIRVPVRHYLVRLYCISYTGHGFLFVRWLVTYLLVGEQLAYVLANTIDTCTVPLPIGMHDPLHVAANADRSAYVHIAHGALQR